MTEEEEIQLYLRIYDRCLKYGNTSPKYALGSPIPVKDIFEIKLRNKGIHVAMYEFSEETGNWSREVLLYFLFRLNLLDSYAFTKMLFSVYCMTDSNTSLFTFFPYATIMAMFEKADIPFISTEGYNNFEDLDQNFIIYRGIRNKPQDINRCGFSWSVRKKIATNFAFQDNPTNTGFIVSGEVSKDIIYGYLTNVGESEIVIAAELVENKVLTALEKTVHDGKDIFVETIIA